MSVLGNDLQLRRIEGMFAVRDNVLIAEAQAWAATEQQPQEQVAQAAGAVALNGGETPSITA